MKPLTKVLAITAITLLILVNALLYLFVNVRIGMGMTFGLVVGLSAEASILYKKWRSNGKLKVSKPQ